MENNIKRKARTYCEKKYGDISDEMIEEPIEDFIAGYMKCLSEKKQSNDVVCNKCYHLVKSEKYKFLCRKIDCKIIEPEIHHCGWFKLA